MAIRGSTPPARRPLENLTLWQRVHDHLREEILSGRLSPARSSRRSRSPSSSASAAAPLREAIGRLASEGLVTVRPRRGAVVRSLSKDEFLEALPGARGARDAGGPARRPAAGDEDVAALERLIETMAAHAERDEVAEFFEANAAFHVLLVEAAGNAKLLELYRAAARPDRPLPPALAEPAREPRPLGRRARRDPAGGEARRCRARRAPDVGAHPRAAAQPQGLERRGARRRGAEVIEFGVNLNNREPLIAPDYDLQMLLDLSELVEESGFDSVWVGDSLFSKPRYEPISLLSAISQRTSRVRLGTSCMVSSTRNPLYLALEWATLDVISGGRTILGTGMGNPEEGVRREFEALGLDYVKRGALFEEGLAVLRQLWTEGKTDFKGELLRLRRRRVLLGDGDGPADADPAAAADLGRLQPAAEGRRSAGRDRAPARGGVPPHRQVRRRLDDLLPRAAPGGARRAARRDRALRGRARRRLLAARDLLPGDDEHRRLGGRGARRLRRLHLEVLPGAVEGDGPLELGAGRHPGPDRRSGSARSPRPASTTSSAASARSTSSRRSSGSRRKCCPCSPQRE